MHPARSEIEFETSLQLLVAVILSAQSTDRMANRLARELLDRYPTVEKVAGAEPVDVERMLRPIGFFRAKARLVISCSRVLVERFGGQLPECLEELLALPGIGRKSANAILAIGFGAPAIVADRHLIRVAGRLRIVSGTPPQLVEVELKRRLPTADWTPFSLRMTPHGRYVCTARRPLCERCVLNDFCPSSSTRGWPAERRRALALSLRRDLQPAVGARPQPPS